MPLCPRESPSQFTDSYDPTKHTLNLKIILEKRGIFGKQCIWKRDFQNKIFYSRLIFGIKKVFEKTNFEKNLFLEN